jgi:protein-tyrosine phosphatase
MDLKSLNFVGTKYFLLEWPFTQFPLYGREVVDRIQELGYTPIFAHIERYEYFWNDPEALDEYIDEGVVCQINPGILLNSSTRKYALKMIKNGYVHVLSSDAHSMEKRPPHLKLAYEVLEKGAGRKTAEIMRRNAERIFQGEDILY